MGEVSNARSVSGSNVVCIQGGGVTSQNSQGCGWKINVSFTLNATDIHGVAYEIHSDREPSGRQQSKGIRRQRISDIE